MNLKKEISMNLTTPKKKIVVIGAGNVGEAVCYTLMVRKQADEIVLVDINEPRARAAALDIAHGTGFYKNVNVYAGGYEECKDASLIIVTAGVGRKPGQTRLELAKTNVAIAKSISKEIMKYAKNPIIIVVANPVDTLTYVIRKETGLPANQVIGTGTCLDTARIRYHLANLCKTNVTDIKAYILGEHGDSQVPVYSQMTIAGEKLEDFERETGIHVDLEALSETARKSGATIIEGKGATFYGVSMATSMIVQAIFDDENAVIPVSHVIDEGEYAGVAFSLPCIINRTGIVRVIQLPLNDKEKEGMAHSAEVLRESIAAAE